MLLIHWNFSIPHTGGELADPYYGWLHILQGCYYLLNPFSWRGGTRLYQTLVCCFQNMEWLYKSWESKIWGCAELMIHPYWVHLDKICLRSVKHLIKKCEAIMGHRSFHWHHNIIHWENWTLWYILCKCIVLDRWSGAKEKPLQQVEWDIKTLFDVYTNFIFSDK